MAEKDIMEKILLSNGDVFADCENALIYKGRQKLRSGELFPAPTESFYGVRQNNNQGNNPVQRTLCEQGEDGIEEDRIEKDGTEKDRSEKDGTREGRIEKDRTGKYRQKSSSMHNQFCDVSFYLVRDGEIRAQYIIENETEIRRRQVLRKASYQGGAYRSQLESGKPVYPVVGVVLDWTGRKTRIPLSLRELLAQDGAPADELELVDEVKLQVFHMRNLPDEVRRRFTGDMGFVVDYLNEGGFQNRESQKIIHVEALCGMMMALTGDERFLPVRLDVPSDHPIPSYIRKTRADALLRLPTHPRFAHLRVG